LEASGYIRSRWSYRWYAEYASNICDSLKSNVGYDCAYDHLIYKSGYHFNDKVIGHGAESDARIGSVGIILTNDEATAWQVLLRFGDLNVGNLPEPPNTPNRLTPTPQKIASADIQFGTTTRIGRFQIGIGYEEIDDEASGLKTDDTRAFVSWTSP
jgi:hypothetical protein